VNHARRIAILALLALAAALSQRALTMPAAPSVELLIETSETVLGQEFLYPKGRARITAAVVTVPPGAVLPRHLHPVPVFGYLLQGELVVDYGSEGERVYRKGDALVEAYDWPHRGHNGGRGIVKILVVYAGAEGVPDTEPAELE